jgi:hypothetical protein
MFLEGNESALVMEREETKPMRRPNLAPIFRWLTLVTAILVLLQAILAGRGLWIDPDFIDMHEIVANLLFLVVVVQLALAFAIGIPGDLGRRMKVMNAVLLVALVVQIALGYSGPESREAAAWHIPLGVFIFGLAGAIADMAPRILKQGGDELGPAETQD